jgi:hypothetical protein
MAEFAESGLLTASAKFCLASLPCTAEPYPLAEIPWVAQALAVLHRFGSHGNNHVLRKPVVAQPTNAAKSVQLQHTLDRCINSRFGVHGRGGASEVNVMQVSELGIWEFARTLD